MSNHAPKDEFTSPLAAEINCIGTMVEALEGRVKALEDAKTSRTRVQPGIRWMRKHGCSSTPSDLRG